MGAMGGGGSVPVGDRRTRLLDGGDVSVFGP